jgi:hypothetical protein
MALLKIGSNQYKYRYLDHWQYNFICYIAFVIVLVLFFYTDSIILSPVSNRHKFTVEANEQLITTTPTPTIEPSIEQKIRETFGDQADEAIKVARCESNLRPDAMNPNSTATGLFQIMASVHGVRRDWLTNPDVNIEIAKELYDASGWNPWNASKHCWGN